jgi:hypothetical protein
MNIQVKIPNGNLELLKWLGLLLMTVGMAVGKFEQGVEKLIDRFKGAGADSSSSADDINNPYSAKNQVQALNEAEDNALAKLKELEAQNRSNNGNSLSG